MFSDLEKGKSLYKRKRYELALVEFRSLGDEPSENLELSYYLGLCYTKLEQYEEALLYLEQVVTNHTNLILIYQSRMILSYIYIITGRFRLAEFELNQLVESGFESAQVFSAYGYVEYSLSRIDESLNYFQKALTIDPDNALTGPLARKDFKTIKRNLSALANDPYKKVYEAFLNALGIGEN